MLTSTIGFLGFGNMGRAIAAGLIEQGAVSAAQLAAFDVDPEKREQAVELGIKTFENPSDLAAHCDALVLAVKPQSMDEALRSLAPGITPKTLVISIAAGISISFIAKRLGDEFRIVRVMPNTPALVNAGAAGIARAANCTDSDLEVAQAIFESIGIVELVEESLIDAVTALSGSGPAYFFYFVECLVKAGVVEGLTHSQATRLATQTLLGAGKLLSESGEPPAVLREKVTSKGGTTEAALNALKAAGFEATVAGALRAAVARARELGK
ncbi:MAG: pyrroline-5-carboxylate reductase [Candidatus Hydrogenedentes bacterium]|nr:pyrroline-5-carboxylate reductase [Candidatus Hydrogenedentota bacterium]